MLFLTAIFLWTMAVNATDTIKMMQYNLMYYTENAPDGCDNNTNALSKKENCIKTIIQYVKPDVLCVNEIGKTDEYANRLLVNALNQDNIDYYAFCPTVSNNTGITIGNRLFYDTRKLVYENSYYFPTGLTYFNCYQFYCRSAELEKGDTTRLTFIVTHLKSGSYEENQESRTMQVQTFLEQLKNSGRKENFILSGDFNIGNASEYAFQLLIDNGDNDFYDPINQIGEWHDNSDYAMYHTQSTHSGYASGICFSGGGFDNRYDLILVSPDVYFGTNGVKSINSSYTTVGQDGKRLNKGLLHPANTSGIPENVLDALYNSSDHLPVTMEIEVDATAVGVKELSGKMKVNIVNPILDNKLEISLYNQTPTTHTLDVFTADGRQITTQTFQGIGQQHQEIAFPYSSGIYIIKITDDKGHSIAKKVIK
ncbi:MAG: T9SS type A sorting domain-containing protein [Bacteroidales bacterium]|nr:T9SS type A sorting domain-containing protein [Bacteroidales bacterium]